MPLVKGSSKRPGAGGGRADIALHEAALGSAEAESRWAAARALAGRTDAVPVLAAALAAETVPRVREAIMTTLMGSSSSVSK